VLLLLGACAHGPAPGRSAPGFEVRHAPGDDAAAEQVARVLPGAADRVARWGRLELPVTVRIHPSHAGLVAAAGRPGDAWLRAWARPTTVEVQSPRTWTRGWASDEAMSTLLAHELTHCLLFQRIGPGWMERDVPVWFEEGLASVTAGERHRRADPSALRPSDRDIRSDAALAYGTADRAFRHLLDRHGEASVREIIALLAAGRDFPTAFRTATGIPVAAFEGDFRRLGPVASTP
jgi:hypothetical protein